MKKNVWITLASLAAVYAAIYFYQRYERKKANERKATLNEANKIIEEL